MLLYRGDGGMASRGKQFQRSLKNAGRAAGPMESSPARGLGSVENDRKFVQANAPKSEESGPGDP